MDTKGRTRAWIDVLLLGGALLAGLGACGILALMAWQAPEAVRAAYAPTPAWTATATQTTAPSTTPSPTATPQPTATALHTPTAAVSPGTPAPGTAGKWIDIDLSEQTLTAYQGEVPVWSVAVSTGKANTPTPLGEFAIYARVPVQDMGGPGYLLRDVQYVAYFEGDYAIHATYWHDNFGQPMSHGCVNMRTADARWLFEWAPIGTPVRVHE